MPPLQRDKRDQILKEYINRRSIGEEGFTALHFASFHGNLKIIKFLISQGADIHMTNRHKINMLHVAAQGDNPLSFYFFLKAGLDINSIDRRMSTPLHWAAYSG